MPGTLITLKMALNQLLRSASTNVLLRSTLNGLSAAPAASVPLVNGNLLLGSSRNVHSSRRNYSATSAKPLSKIDSKVKCTLIPGDGVGPELCAATIEVLTSMQVPVEFEELFLSEIHPTMSVPVEQVAESINKNGIALKGILSTPYTAGTAHDLQSLNMRLRKLLDTFANVVHVRSLEGIETRHKNLDFIIIREQTEGEYSALEHESVPGVIECMKIVTEEKSRRIAKFAFDYATKHNRKKVTAVHKANIMKLGDGLFLRCCEETSHLYPNIEFDAMIIDNTCMQLVSHPHKFDVMVMPNLYGNIIDNLASGLVGGAGIVPGASYSSDCVIYEPGARHTFGEAVGKNIANPTAMLLCAVKMLRHVNLHDHASRLEEGLLTVIKTGKVKTRDLGGYASTTDFTRAVVSSLPF